MLRDFIEPEIQLQRNNILDTFYNDFFLNNIILKKVKSRFRLTDIINCDPNLVEDPKIKRIVSQNYGDNFELVDFPICKFYEILKYRLTKTYDNDTEDFYKSKTNGLFKLRISDKKSDYIYNLKFSKMDFSKTFIERKNMGYINITTNLPGRVIYAHLMNNSENYYNI